MHRVCLLLSSLFLTLFPLSKEKSCCSGACRNYLMGTRGESAQGKPIDCRVPAEPQRWCLVPHSVLSQAGRFSCRRLTLGLEHNLNSSCSVRHEILQTSAVPFVGLSLSVITMNKEKRIHTGLYRITYFFA